MSSVDLNKIAKKVPAPDKAAQQTDWLAKLDELLNRDFQLPSGSAIDDNFKESYYSELALLLSEGIDIKSAFTIIVDEIEKPKISEQLSHIQKQIVNGEKFADAVKENKNFSDYEYYSLAIGEESGKLIEILNELSIYFKRKVKLKRQLSSALIYPAIVLSVALGAIIFMMNFVVPMFSEVFKRFKGELPAITKGIIAFSLFFKSYFWIIALLFIACIVFLYTQRKKDWFRKYGSQVIIKIPVFGQLVRKIYLARFCQSLSLLLRSRVSIIKSLDMLHNMINFYPIEVSIEPIKARILKGNSLHSALSAYSIYNKKMVNMIKVAEDVNKLDEMLAKISVQLSDETEHQIELFNKLLEPILIVILGFVVGTILVAMYLPLFQLGSQIGA
jgi:type IV pilus assembly protein PilC